MGKVGVRNPGGGYKGYKKPPDATKEFRFSTEEELKAQNAPLPYVQARKELLENPAGRSLIGQAIMAGRRAMAMPPVQSNAELQERLDEYFAMAAEREIPPTVEEMALYCGYTSNTFREWQSGRNRGFRDEKPGVTTSSICKKAMDLMHQIDAILAEGGKLNTIAYIFRSKNYYGMSDKQEIVVTPSSEGQQPLSPEEIAARLPDPDADYSVK